MAQVAGIQEHPVATRLKHPLKLFQPNGWRTRGGPRLLIILACISITTSLGSLARAQDAPPPADVDSPRIDEDEAARGAVETLNYELSLTDMPGGPPADAEPVGEVLQEVWLRNPQVQQALSEVEAAGYDISGARTGFYPFLQVNSTQADSNASATTVSVVQPIWSGGRVDAEIDQARAQRDVALAGLNQSRLDLGLQTSEAYLNVALAREQVQLWERYLESLKYLLAVIKNRVDKGVAPAVDVETATTRLREAQAGLYSSRAALRTNRSQLESLLNRPAGGAVWPHESLELTPAEIDAILVNGVVDAHPARQQALAEIDAAEARVDSSKAGLWPQITLQHSRQVEQSAGDFTPDSSTQLVFQYQTDNTLRGIRGMQAEEQRVESARQGLAFAQQDIANRIRTAAIERASAREQFRAQRESAESAIRLVDSFLRQFKVGRKTWIEVLNAQREANNALLQATTVKRTYWSANLRLALEGMRWKRLNEDAPPVYIDRLRGR